MAAGCKNMCSAALWLICLIGLCGCVKQPEATASAAPKAARERIISLAPSLTEILFALELGDEIVADTQFCETPEAAKALPKVGGWTDVNMEQIMSFRPSCVCLGVNHPMRSKFEQLSIPLLPVAGSTLEDVISSIQTIGSRFGREAKAAELTNSLRERMVQLRQRAAQRSRALKVLIVAYRVRGEGRLRDLSVAGDDGYFQALLSLIGCELVPSGTGVPYPQMSAEGVLAVNPDVIVEIAPEMADAGAVVKDWEVALPALKAVQAHRVLVFTENYATVPGLRSLLFAEKLADRLETLHVE